MLSDDPIGAGDRWIPEDEYDFIRARVPILCVDLIPLSEDEPPKIGLIERDIYGGGTGWCIVGGAVLRNEPLIVALQRHLHATLGHAVTLNLETLSFLDVIEYFAEPDIGEFYDPRKHSVSLVHFGRCHGPIQVTPRGEANDFRWYKPEESMTLKFGYGQGKVVERYLRIPASGHKHKDPDSF